MQVLLFLGNSICYAGQSATGKRYVAKGGDARSFNFCKAAAACLLFLIWLLLRGDGIHWSTASWALVYGICLTVSMYTGFQALSCGPMALTGMLAAMSLTIPFLWGILFWQESLTVWSIIGVLLLLCAIAFINLRKEGKISGKWLFYCAMTMVANGFCSVIQKYHQLAFPGRFQVDFMFFAMAAVTVILLFSLLFQKGHRLSFSLLGGCSGILNGLANLFVLLLAANQDAAALFPVVGAGNVMAAYLCGILFFRERIRKLQLVGLLVGMAGIILMQIT